MMNGHLQLGSQVVRYFSSIERVGLLNDKGFVLVR